jgi:L-alanine-DL-glutamate epimerase-like enolase superfamily enzyme
MSPRVELIPIRVPMTGGRAYEAVLVVMSRDGVSGLGEAPVLTARGGSLDGLLEELRAGAPRSPAAAAAWETARLDLEARERGVSLAELLGGAHRRRVRCTALVEDLRPDAVARAVERLREGGFQVFKLKAANAGGQLDLERLGAARWAGGPNAGLRLDFNGDLPARAAESALPTLSHLHLELVEQPLPKTARAAQWAALAAATGVALAADESLGDRELACELARQGTGLAIKLATVGGPQAALALARAAAGPVTFGSSYETGVGIAAALHTACALQQPPLACGLATRRLLEADLTVGLPEGPELELPSGAGLGVDLDPEAVARYRLDR